jgi:hypothetical protein
MPRPARRRCTRGHFCPNRNDQCAAPSIQAVMIFLSDEKKPRGPVGRRGFPQKTLKKR